MYSVSWCLYGVERFAGLTVIKHLKTINNMPFRTGFLKDIRLKERATAISPCNGSTIIFKLVTVVEKSMNVHV